MTPERYQRIKSIYFEASGTSGADRIAVLDRACGPDTELREEVEKLLAAHAPATAVIHNLVTPPDPEAVERAIENMHRDTVDSRATFRSRSSRDARDVPPQIDGYEIEHAIGAGGMGTVYAAQQRKPRRRVALKVMLPGFASRTALRRFEFEAQVLAHLRHPGIAQVYEAGTFLANGLELPFFAMEYVPDAVTLSQYGEGRRLNTRSRLELFCQVCDAVHYGHQKGVIHRDLKPSNILVDAAGAIKVIDFGVARSMDSDLTVTTMQTDVGQLIGTLQYMSPEQVAANRDDIDTRSDVYALGVILYELLCGRTPYDIRDLSIFEATRLIREAQPARPATVDRSLRGDIETIVLKALQKEREQRYQSAAELGQDVQRFLSGQAILARPASTVYQLRVFARQHKVVLVACAAVLFALVGGLSAALYGLARESAQRHLAEASQTLAEENSRKAEASREVAETEQAKAEAINTFLLRMLGSADLKLAGRNATVAQALARASADIAGSLQKQPEVAIGIRRILAQTYTSLGMLDEAELHAHAALVLARSLQGDDSGEALEALRILGLIGTSRGNPAAAEKLLRPALAASERVLGPDSEHAVALATDLANALRLQKQFAEAEKLYRRVLGARYLQSNDKPGELLIAINSMAVLLHDQRRLDEVEPLYREAMDIGERVFGHDDPDTLVTGMNMGSLLKERGRYQEAEALEKDIVTRARTVFGERHPQTASMIMSLGQLYTDSGRFREALPLIQESAEIYSQTRGQRTEVVAECNDQLAFIHSRLGDPAAAVPFQRSALEVLTEVLGATHEKTIKATTQLGNYLFQSGQAAEAEPLLRRGVELAEQVLGTEHKSTGIALNSYAFILRRQRRLAEAEAMLRQALDAGRRAKGPDEPNALITLHNLISVLAERGELEAARDLAADALTVYERVFGPQHPNLAHLQDTYASVLRRLKDNAAAEPLLKRALDIRRQQFGPHHPTTISNEIDLAEVWMRLGRPLEAERALRSIVEMRRDEYGDDDLRTTQARSALGRCLTVQKRFEEAEDMLLHCYELLADSPASQEPTIDRLAALYKEWNAAEPGADHAEDMALWQTRLNEWRAARDAQATLKK